MVGLSVLLRQGTRTPLRAVPLPGAKRSTWGVESLSSVVDHMIGRMNVERLHTITETLRLEIEQTGIVSKMQRLATGLQEMVVNGHLFLPVGGQQKCPLVATRTARSWPTDLPTGVSVALAMVVV